MPLTRSELIARSLVHANKMTQGTVQLPSLIDHPHFNHLSPEEKAEVISQYAYHVKNDPDIYETPGLLNTITSGASRGILASILPAVTAGALTVPSIMALKAANGNPIAMKDILRRTLIPMGVVGALGAGAGIYGSLMQRAADRDNNKYLNTILHSIEEEQDPDQRSIKSMALMAAAPAFNRRLQANESVGVGTQDRVLGSMFGPDSKKLMQGVMGFDQHHLINLEGKTHTTNVPYNDWRFVRGVDRILDEDMINRKWEMKEIPQ